MSLTNTHVVFICFAFLCILMGMQYSIYGGEENTFRNDFHFFLGISEIFGIFFGIFKKSTWKDYVFGWMSQPT